MNEGPLDLLFSRPFLMPSKLMKPLLILLSLCGLGRTCLPAAPPAPAQPLLYTVPFKAGDEGARIYRIPALWWQPKKPLMAFAERRMEQRRMTGDVDIVLRRSLDHGQSWQAQQVIADFGRDTCGNPCVVEDATTQRLWLAFTRSRNADTEEQIVAAEVPGTQVWITHSDDEGASWAAPRDLSATCRKPNWGWYGTGPGQGVFLRGGTSRPDRLLLPAYHTEGGVYRTHCLYSDDHGETWQVGADAAEHSSEPQVIEMAPGTLLMNARTIAGHGTQRTLVVSKDRGTTWQPAEGLAALPENACQGCLYRCFRNGSSGQYDWIFSQPAASNRTSVTAWISSDDGQSWPAAQLLWAGPSAYTSMVRVQSGLVGMLIECGARDVYEQIAFVKFAPEWLKARPAPEIKAPAPKP